MSESFESPGSVPSAYDLGPLNLAFLTALPFKVLLDDISCVDGLEIGGLKGLSKTDGSVCILRRFRVGFNPAPVPRAVETYTGSFGFAL